MKGASKLEAEPSSEEASRIPVTIDVLGDHLYQKVREILSGKLCVCESLSEKITGMLLECGEDDIAEMLGNEDRLTNRISVAYSCLIERTEPGELRPWNDLDSSEKNDLGERLYEEISKLDSALCAQITGMLMELDCATLRGLLEDETKLKMSVDKSKASYLQSTGHTDDTSSHPGLSDVDLEELGEQLYDIIHTVYPSDAGKITGMLLESDPRTLFQLVEKEDVLWGRVSMARRVLKEDTDA